VPLLARLQEAAQRNPDGGGRGFTMFCCPEFLERYETPGRQTERLTFANRFYLKPFVEGAFAPQEFLILGLSRKHLRLVEFKWGHCRDLPLPKEVPENVEVAGAFDQPDHDLENRSAAGSFTGSMKAVRFGNSTDASIEYLHRFFTLVDRGLEKLRAGRPLLLMGVLEEIAAYRRATHESGIGSTHILGQVPGNIEFLALDEISALASRAALAHRHAQGEKVLAEWTGKPDRTHTLSGVNVVLKAASQGRIHQLVVRADAQKIGPLPPDLDPARIKTEDLINAAIVETLRHRGEVFELPADRMSADQPLAAILRY
jgi:hypothetical protein